MRVSRLFYIRTTAKNKKIGKWKRSSEKASCQMALRKIINPEILLPLRSIITSYGPSFSKKNTENKATI